MYNKPLVIIDFETTGLDVGRDYPIQAAAAVLNPDGSVDEQFVTDIAVPWYARYTRDRKKGAFNVHGISWDRLTAAPTQIEAVWKFGEVAASFPKALLAGSNVAFDYWMLKRLYKLAGRDSIPFDYHTVDLSALGEIVLGVRSLKKIATTLGLDPKEYKAHDAMGDVRLTAQCFKLLLPQIERRKITAEIPALSA